MSEPIHVLGGGAVGLALAASLAREGRRVVLVRTSRRDTPEGRISISVQCAEHATWRAEVETRTLSRMETLGGLVVLTTKSHANAMLAQTLAAKATDAPLIVMQNGMGVEEPFLAAGFSVYRCVLYMTAQTIAGNEVRFRPVRSSPIGLVRGTTTELARCVELLSTEGFPFHAEENIQRDVWKKTILNAVFNSICPLLDVDNGIFARDEDVLALARAVIVECVALANTRHVALTEGELLENALAISRGSSGVLISTLQDIRNGRPTEIDSLNLELARLAATTRPPVDLIRTELLGRLTQQKAKLLLR